MKPPTTPLADASINIRTYHPTYPELLEQQQKVESPPKWIQRLRKFFTTEMLAPILYMGLETMRDVSQNPESYGTKAGPTYRLLESVLPWIAHHMGDIFEVAALYIVIRGGLEHKNFERLSPQRKRILTSAFSSIPIALIEYLGFHDPQDAIGALLAGTLIFLTNTSVERLQHGIPSLSRIVTTTLQKIFPLHPHNNPYPHQNHQ